ISLPGVPQFEPFEHPVPRHSRTIYLPDDLQNACNRNTHAYEQNYHRLAREPSSNDLPSPLSFFKLFFTDEEFEILAENTNAYVRQKEAGRQGRPWWATSSAEIKIFFGLVIYMGVYHCPGVSSYWS